MNAIYYIGLDIHKKSIAYCIKKIDGTLVHQGNITADRKALQGWLIELPALGSVPWKPPSLLAGFMTFLNLMLVFSNFLHYCMP
ncbi:hypothetical protein [Geotalea toluenoxydans]|uniref:hypothetical protein n=1 Tax=Geotalea toluenoxydans TaxID=421624 RepID=UPI0006D0C415|nr:hypothetical protein [Geotalea toluenoxydans]